MDVRQGWSSLCVKINLKRLAGNWAGLGWVGGRGSPRGEAAAATANFEGTFHHISTHLPTFPWDDSGSQGSGQEHGEFGSAATGAYFTLP